MLGLRNCTLDKEISKVNSYPLLDYYKGYKIPIVSDSMFKTMINNESRKEYICYLISSIFDEDYDYIFKNTEFIKNNIDKHKDEESNKTVDLLCNIKGIILNVEVNNNASKASLERNLYYMFSLYGANMKKKSKYNFNKTVQLNLNNFSFKGKNDVLEECFITNINHIPKDKDDFDIYSSKIRIINIYLPNIKKREYNKLELYEKLLLIFNENDNELLNDLSKGDEIMERYVKESKEASEKDEVIGMYNKEIHNERLRLAEIDEFKEKSFKEGLTVGHEEGFGEGRVVGHNEGVCETKIETAKNLLKEDVGLDIISRSTGLSIEELKKLKEVE